MFYFSRSHKTSLILTQIEENWVLWLKLVANRMYLSAPFSRLWGLKTIVVCYLKERFAVVSPLRPRHGRRSVCCGDVGINGKTRKKIMARPVVSPCFFFEVLPFTKLASSVNGKTSQKACKKDAASSGVSRPKCSWCVLVSSL